MQCFHRPLCKSDEESIKLMSPYSHTWLLCSRSACWKTALDIFLRPLCKCGEKSIKFNISILSFKMVTIYDVFSVLENYIRHILHRSLSEIIKNSEGSIYYITQSIISGKNYLKTSSCAWRVRVQNLIQIGKPSKICIWNRQIVAVDLIQSWCNRRHRLASAV